MKRNEPSCWWVWTGICCCKLGWELRETLAARNRFEKVTHCLDDRGEGDDEVDEEEEDGNERQCVE